MGSEAHAESERALPAALREFRAVDGDDPPDVAERLLRIVARVTGSSRARLEHPHLPGPTTVDLGSPRDGLGSGACLRIDLPIGVAGDCQARLELHRIGAAFDDASAQLADVLGGELIVRIEHARARARAADAARHLELVRALTRAGTEVLELAEIADRTAREILEVFSGVHVSLHVLRDRRLELISRRFPGGSRLDSAPDWFLTLSVDAPIIQAVAVRERRILSRPLHELSDRGRAALAPLGVRQLVAVPLIADDAVVGVMSVARRCDDAWTPAEFSLLERTASKLAAALVRVRVIEEERKRARDLAVLNELGARVAQTLDLSAVLNTAAAQLSQITGVLRVHVFLSDPAGTRLDSAACTDPAGMSLSFDVDGPAAVAHSFRSGVPVLIDDAQSDPRTDKSLVAQLGTRAILAVPLSYQGRSIGVLALVETRNVKTFTKSEIERAIAVANLVAPAIANAQMFRDLRESYEALAKAQAEIVRHERLAALGELSAVIAHEVRNPLAVIFNSVGSLRRIVPSTDDGELLLDIIAQEGKRLNRIVGDLLDFVRPYKCHPRPGRLDAVVSSAVEAAQRAAPESCVSVRVETALCAESAVFDETMLHQALLNLVVNAVQATPRDGEVNVRACTEEHDGALRFRCEIVDQGPGIDPNDGRIFEPFFTTKPTGTGLGLAIVRRIAAELGGAVTAARAQPSGSIFTLVVPLSPAG